MAICIIGHSYLQVEWCYISCSKRYYIQLSCKFTADQYSSILIVPELLLEQLPHVPLQTVAVLMGAYADFACPMSGWCTPPHWRLMALLNTLPWASIAVVGGRWTVVVGLAWHCLHWRLHCPRRRAPTESYMLLDTAWQSTLQRLWSGEMGKHACILCTCTYTPHHTHAQVHACVHTHPHPHTHTHTHTHTRTHTHAHTQSVSYS